MLLSMIVMITSCAPVRAFSTPGMHAVERRRRRRRRAMTIGISERPGHVGQPAERADPRGRGRADEQLALDADVEQAGPERERHGQRGADERRRAAERGGDAVGVPNMPRSRAQ